MGSNGTAPSWPLTGSISNWNEGCGAIFGTQRSGKNTLIRTLTGILRLDEGQVSVFGESPEAARRRVGYLPEERGVPRRAKVGEWLTFLGRLRGLTTQEARKRALYWLEKVDLPGVERSRCRELSKGMQQKVQLAAALQHNQICSSTNHSVVSTPLQFKSLRI